MASLPKCGARTPPLAITSSSGNRTLSPHALTSSVSLVPSFAISLLLSPISFLASSSIKHSNSLLYKSCASSTTPSRPTPLSAPTNTSQSPPLNANNPSPLAFEPYPLLINISHALQIPASPRSSHSSRSSSLLFLLLPLGCLLSPPVPCSTLSPSVYSPRSSISPSLKSHHHLC